MLEKRKAFVQEIYTECEINAPADKVYAVISDFHNYNQWTKNLVIEGDTSIGGKMTVMVNDRGTGWVKLSSRMIKNGEGIVSFENSLYAPFLFKGLHRYEAIPCSENRAKFVNAEVFSGLSVPFVRKRLLRDTRKFKENTNAALKKYVEEHLS